MNDIRIVQDMPAEQYHASTELSKSGLDQFKRSPAHYKAWLDGQETNETTPAMVFGSAVHCALLEPKKFESEYSVFSGDRRTKAGKEEYETLKARGIKLISAEDQEAIRRMQQNILTHNAASKLIKPGTYHAEVSVFGEINGIKTKARMDILPHFEAVNGDCIGDIKTTSDASPAEFAKSIANFRYHVQAAWYLRFFPTRTRFVFIAIEKTPPYELAVYELDQQAIDLGNYEIDRQLELFRSCQDFDSWPGYSTQTTTLNLPTWAYTKKD